MKDDYLPPTPTDQLLEDAIDAIKTDEPSEADVARAAARVKQALAPHRGPQAIVAEDGKLTAAANRWDSIEDYIAAIPAYLAGELSPAQTTLFEEEARASIPLRRALNEAKGRAQSQQIADQKSSRTGWYALAATVAALAIGVIIALPQLPSFDQSQLAQVDTVDGQLYQLVNGRLETLTPGTWIDGRQRIRSAPGSKAFITLDDGSEIEIDGRSELSMVRRGAGNRIDVSRGRILVHAAPQASGTLDVFTDEMEVSVVGTIFEVAHGAKGSRVAVVEGSVNVLLQGNRTALEPGQVMGSRDMQYLAQNAADAVSWSLNADEYIAMLQEVQALQQELQTVMQSPSRYSTRLLDLAPETTAIYMAVPNAPQKIADVYNVVKARAQSSEFLAQQWAEFEAQSEAQYIDELMMWIGEIGTTLGEETVVILDTASFDNLDGAVPIILSEVNSASFAASFELMAQRLEEVLLAEGHDSDDFELALVNDPSEAREGELSIMLLDDIMVATIDAATMVKMAGIIENGGSAFVNSDLHALLSYSYVQGTQILGAVDIETLFDSITEDVEAEDRAEMAELGVDNVKYLIAQGLQQDGWSTMSADLYFDGPRRGVMTLLAEPAPMGSLEFYSTDTTMVAAMLLRDPMSFMDEFGSLEIGDEIDAQAELELFMNVLGVLGGEFALGLDGPALPTPSWKVVLEAYDADIIQQAVEWSVDRINAEFAAENIDSSIELSAANVGGYPGYRVSLSFDPSALQSEEIDFAINFSSVSFHYAFVDGYLVAAPSTGLISRAIDYYQSGSGLPTSGEFQDLLARDGYLDFSAIYFSRLGELMSDVLGALPSNLTAEQQAAIDAMNTDIGPTMVSALALSDRIHFAHSGSTEFPTQMLSQLAVFAPFLEDLEEEYPIID